MKKLLVTALLASGFAMYAQEPRAHIEELKVIYKQKEDTMTAKDFIVAGVIGGCAIELANVIRKDENYKKVLAFAADYPGVFVASVSASAGLMYMYGKGIKNFLSRYKVVSKPS
ncbi:hypothetical protein Noda2021_05700 [Candidatus Dependentiae bacterium Noda2021]|nr:hypothetical protein Noda2021_05700 [Candidatus Dependentiae bacterium Noda2021]